NCNSWAAATEVKAYLNEKGINTKLFDVDKLQSLRELENYLTPPAPSPTTRLGVVGGVSDWLVSSTPDEDLLDEVLDIELVNFSWDELLELPEGEDFCNFAETFGRFGHDSFASELSLVKRFDTLIKQNNLDAITVGCFGLIGKVGNTICLPVSAMNNCGFPAACEGDLCSATGMMIVKRLTGKIPWMANLSYADREAAIFSHCTVQQNLLDKMEVTTHYETGKYAAVKGEMKGGEVTIFRIDRKLENCFLSLGEIVGNCDSPMACRTQVKVKMSVKGLFSLREFPLGNHHLIIDGDCTDVIAEYFTNKGFRIV
ncbi:MAG: hypothetical protein II060_05345, partial [Bacteroidales bacterium]|nr:hypothetical protein [Bacteroidales bacterium]